MKKVLLYLVLILLAASCNRTKEKSIQPARDYILIQEGLSNVIPLIIHTGQSNNYLMDRIRHGLDTLNSCASYTYLGGDTVDINVEPVQYEINYNQCEDYDGELKNGSLMCILNDYFNVDSSSCFVNFDSFSINNNILVGSVLIKRNGGNNYKIITSNLKLIIGTREINYTGTVYYTLSTGSNIDWLYDNQLIVTDKGSLNDRYSQEVTVNNAGIIKNLSCEWFSEGFVELEDESKESIVLDYGDGSCDNKGVVTNSGEDIVINL